MEDSGCKQPSLLRESDWREQVRGRVDAFRSRKQMPPPEPDSRLLTFPQKSGVPPSRPRLETNPEPVAEPVILPPRRAGSAEPEIAWTRVVLRPEAEAALAPALVEPEPSDPGLAEPIGLGPREPHRIPPPPTPLPRSLSAEGPAFLQIPLPLSAAAGASSVPALLPVAARARRIGAGLNDAAVVLLGSLLFAAAGWGWLGCPAPSSGDLRHLLPALLGVPGLLAAVYLLACGYALGATIGTRSSGLRVCGFDGEGVVTARQLRLRAWASLISLAALGLGFLWIYLDPQQLGWHDYISRTYVAES